MAKKNKIFARTGRIFFFKRVTLEWSLDLSSKALNAKKEKEKKGRAKTFILSQPAKATNYIHKDTGA